jgi:acyl transferase domain-containing protein
MQISKPWILSQVAAGEISPAAAQKLLASLVADSGGRGERAIAVIGMAGRFPGADDLGSFWRNLRDGVSGLGSFPEERAREVRPFLSAGDRPFARGGYLADISSFAARLFNVLPREAELMNPHQRLFLEVAWQALDDAGYNGAGLRRSRTGVYVGGGDDEYQKLIRKFEPAALAGNVSALISGRVSYVFDLLGPNLMADTSCSSSLVAVHLACRALRDGECDMAIAGGVSLKLMPLRFEEMTGSIMSPDEEVRTFDARANGTAVGEGAGAVVLKPLRTALDDGDDVRAVLLGSALSHDGRSNGIASPNARSQAEAILRALRDAHVNPETVSYVEAHGTATRIGDPIEVQGLTEAYRHFTERRQYCPIGSVKTNIGHLDSAAGIAGLLKVILALQHREIPASLHFEQPNPLIDFAASPFYPQARLTPWEAAEGMPRRAGVSSFGISGTNAHLLVEEAPARPRRERRPGRWAVPLSAPSAAGLAGLVDRYRVHLESTDPDPADIAWTAAAGRAHHAARLALVAGDTDELREKLARVAEDGLRGAPGAGIFVGGITGIDDTDDVATGLARRYASGENPDWAVLFDGAKPARIPLPGHPFERERYWVTPGAPAAPVPVAPLVPEAVPAVAALPAAPPRPPVTLKNHDPEGPNGDLVAALGQIWGEILDLREVDVSEDFLEMGGDSMAALQILHDVEARHGITIPFDTVYEAGSIANLAAAIERRSHGENAIPPAPAAASAEAEEEKPAPGALSRGQQRFWIVQQLDPADTSDHVPILLEIRGLLDPGLAGRTLACLIARHGSLRTSFVAPDGVPRQWVAPASQVALDLAPEDLSELGPEEAEAHLRAVLAEERRRPFDLTRAPLLRVRLFRRSREHHVLYANMHHIVSDGWSMRLLAVDFCKVYHRLAASEPVASSETGSTYLDYVDWQRRQIEGGALREHEAYWLAQLAHLPPRLELPQDGDAGQAVAGEPGGELRMRLAPALAAGLHDFAAARQLSLNMLMLGSYFLLLHLLGQSEDLIVGTPVAGRPSKAFEPVIGCFVNTLPIRVRFGGIATHEELLALVRRTCIEAYKYQDYPLDLLVEKLNPERRAATDALFSTLFLFQNIPIEARFPGFEVTALELGGRTPKFDLTLVIEEEAEGLGCRWQYRRELFSAETVADFAERYELILREMALGRERERTA